jgi:RNA polymerase sigma factor (TIGR02999 family)
MVAQTKSPTESGADLSPSAGELLPLVYTELRKLAAARLAAEKPGQTLQPTALVHEVYLRLVGSDPAKPWRDRAHFLAAAAEAMRRILIENARRKGRLKRGGDRDRVALAANEPTLGPFAVDVLDFDAVLTRFAIDHPSHAEVVKLRYFAGLTLPEVGAVLGVSAATAKRRWAYARAWLTQSLRSRGPVEGQLPKT